jgi:hypothetical protein
MKKKYLKIEIYRTNEFISVGYYLLTDNITAFLFEASTREMRMYFKDANPFLFIRLHLTDMDFFDLMNVNCSKVIESVKEGSKFNYSLIEL